MGRQSETSEVLSKGTSRVYGNTESRRTTLKKRREAMVRTEGTNNNVTDTTLSVAEAHHGPGDREQP